MPRKDGRIIHQKPSFIKPITRNFPMSQNREFLVARRESDAAIVNGETAKAVAALDAPLYTTYAELAS
jgi:hypothetical protein